MTGKVDLAFRLSGDIVAKLDNWRRAQPVIPSKSEAVRFLIELGLRRYAVQSASTGYQQDYPPAAHSPAPKPSTELPLSTATLQQTEYLNVGSSLAGDSGDSGDNPPAPAKRAIEKAEDEAHQKLFRTGIADLVEASGLDENVAHDRAVDWIMKSSALHVLTLIEATANMVKAGNLEPGAVAALISAQVHSYQPITGLKGSRESAET